MSMPTAADRGRRSRRAALKRLIHRLSRLGIRVVRRHGLLPTGIADRNGEDDRLAGSSLTQTVMVYFPGTLEDIYQLQQWYDPLRALDERHPVIVVLQDSRTARRVRTESALAAITIARYSVLDDLLSRSDVKLALYVGHNPENFTALRFTSLAHVFLNHGDSDKGVAVSNQNKAYDFLFVPGQASIDRIQAYTILRDPEPHCMLIGRPQLDVDRVSESPNDGRRRVLYAPTWEGGQPSMAYGSVASHGPAMVRALLDGRFTIVYRPHPLNGVTSAAYADADAAVRHLLAEAAATDPAAGHRVDTECPVSDSFAGADLLDLRRVRDSNGVVAVGKAVGHHRAGVTCGDHGTDPHARRRTSAAGHRPARRRRPGGRPTRS